ncbi:MAG: hypothetical protein K9J33_13755 [Bacteroidales bacterium]|nr:hypothetical protein [Bacteroidales bacterium]
MKSIGKHKVRSCLDSDIFEHLSVIAKKTNSGNVITIPYRDNVGFFESAKKVIKKEGKPICCEYTEYKEHILQAIGYHRTKKNTSYRQYYFFLDDKLLMYEMETWLKTTAKPNDLIENILDIEFNESWYREEIVLFSKIRQLYSQIWNDGFKLHIYFYKDAECNNIMKQLTGIVEAFYAPKEIA